jgi:predicted hydrocarbon binding protein
MPATVHARVPLSLLAAIRDVDSPEGDAEAEYVQELRNKRLGLSDTVYAQIRRYGDAVRRSQQISVVEATGLATLIGRRPDAEQIFVSAGKKVANEVYLTVSSTTRGIILLLPGFLARPLALRQLRKIGRRYFNAVIGRTGSFLTLTVEESVTAEHAPRGVGCRYYESSLRELLRLMVRGSGAVDHVRCITRGEGACEWRADWRFIQK